MACDLGLNRHAHGGHAERIECDQRHLKQLAVPQLSGRIGCTFEIVWVRSCATSQRWQCHVGPGMCPVVARMFGESQNILGSCCPRIHHNNVKHVFLDLHASQFSVTPVEGNTRWFKTSIGRLETCRDTFFRQSTRWCETPRCMSATQMLRKASQANVMQLSRHSADDVMEHISMTCTRYEENLAHLRDTRASRGPSHFGT